MVARGGPFIVESRDYTPYGISDASSLEGRVVALSVADAVVGV